MGLDDVTQEIIDSAEEEAEAIRSEAAAEKEQILDDARAEAEQIRDEAEAAAENEAEALRKKELAAARMDARQAALAAREDVMDDVVDRFHDRIEELDEDDEHVLVAAALDRLDGAVDIGTVHVSDHLHDLASDYGDVEPMAERGVVVESSDGTRRFDLTFDTIADKTVRENRKDLSEVLFD
ncbi:MAG: V-type ATP synthase subunit E family protein [Candidatus Nanohaloarchaea archaeon]|nr:V-type ATP synthase subunit E family protein [Candidatus Nanohaloarchaea archaeon]